MGTYKEEIYAPYGSYEAAQRITRWLETQGSHYKVLKQTSNEFTLKRSMPMNPVEWLIFIGLTALEIIAIILTGGYALAVRLAAAAIVATVNAVLIGAADYFDSNSTPCLSILEAISQLCS